MFRASGQCRLRHSLARNGQAEQVAVEAAALGVLAATLHAAHEGDWASAGLLAASGMTNRRVVSYVAAIFAMLALMPGAAFLLATVPPGVVGAALVFTGAFVVTGGVKMMSERGLGQRRCG